MGVGAPIGNQNAFKGRLWHAAVLRALTIRGRGDMVAALDEIATKLVDACANGDLPALKELGDRLDGKAMQQIEQKTELTGHVETSTRPTLSKEEWLTAHGVGTAARTAV